MTYHEFNKRVFDYYVLKSKSSYCILSLDNAELCAILNGSEIPNFPELRRPWNSLLGEIDHLPQFFGLIALQCYAASLMQRDKDASPSAYRLRFIRVIGLSQEQELNNLFIGADPTKSVQDAIWQNAKAYFKDRLDLDLLIPDPAINAGRYVQYPKSQALLNTEDLKYFIPFFKQEFHAGESLPFAYFKNKVLANLINISLTRRAKLLLDDENLTDLCFQQLFNFFNRWDGDEFDPHKIKSRDISRLTSTPLVSSRITLVFEQGVPIFYLKGNRPLSPDIIRTHKSYKYIYKDLLILEKLPYDTDEYEDSRFIHTGWPVCICLNKYKSSSIYHYLLSHNNNKFNITDEEVLFCYVPSEITADSPLKKFLSEGNPVILQGGLKLNRIRGYLQGFGPNIDCSEQFSVIFKNSKIEYQPRLADIGTYIVRVDGFKDIEFDIIKKIVVSLPLVPKSKGWNFGTYNISIKPDIEGALISTNSAIKEPPLIRRWINVNLGLNELHNKPVRKGLFKIISNAKLNE